MKRTTRLTPVLRAVLKRTLARCLPDSHRLRALLHLPKLDRFLRSHRPYPSFARRYDLYDHLAATHLRGAPVDYLEFGVWKGRSIEYWSRLQPHEESRFFGFDTFTGLPEDWRQLGGATAAGTFDLEGRAPRLDDPRISLIPGLFQETLDDFLKGYEPRSQLVVHHDADLYSATLFVLTRCHPILRPGTILLFDEFSSVLDEFTALESYCCAYLRSCELLGVAGRCYEHVAVRLR